MEQSFLHTKKILLVDDEPELRKLVIDILSDDGFSNIIDAGTVQAGLSLARQEKPDLAILDVMLPDGDGFSLMKKLRAFTNIPVIFLTAKDEAALFLAYSGSKAQISKNTEPIISSIATLSEGKSINLSVDGELSEIADSINKASNVISRQNAARANWISGVSHDIRTPLSMIMGYADRIVNDKDASSQIKGQAAVISRQSIKIKDLVQDLNLVSKLEYEMQPLQKENIRLSKLLRSYAIDLINSGLPDFYSLEVNISPDSENCMVECDAKLITRAVNNLVQNSIHSNPKGCTIILSLQIMESKLLLTVQDNGIGISAEKLEELKNKPHYMESTDDRLDLRHGLGLLLVRQIIEAHHGTTEIESRLHEGYKTKICFSGKPQAMGKL